MNRAFVGIVLIAAVSAVGCGEDDGGVGGMGGGGTGGAGGEETIGPLTWTTAGLTIVGDECEFFVDEPLEFVITIQGSTVIMEDADPQSSLAVSTDSYSPEQNQVLLTGQTTNEDFPPCVAGLDDAFQLALDDPDTSLDMNDTVQVTWTHVETDESAVEGDCEGEWFVSLPCSGEATFTLTQEMQ